MADARVPFVPRADGAMTSTLLRTMTVKTQPEGCAIDQRDGTLYVGEEVVGIWRFRSGQTIGELVAPIDNRLLVADVEGLALVPDGTNGGWLYASSQGDNTYMRFALPDMTPAGRFRIGAGAGRRWQSSAARRNYPGPSRHFVFGRTPRVRPQGA